MDSCERYQAEMLEYLYDLPEEDEQRAFQEHLRQCPTCPARLREARQQQKLLAAAARMTFPGVRFEAPAEAVSAGPQILSLPKRPTQRRWLAWAVAAGLLLALGGLSMPLIHSWKAPEVQVGRAEGNESNGTDPKGQSNDGPPSKPEPRKFFPASANVISAWVDILRVNQESRTIQVRTRRGEIRNLTLTPNTQIVIRGAKGSLADLQPGQSVLLTLEENSKGQWSNLKRVEDEASAKAAGKL